MAPKAPAAVPASARSMRSASKAPLHSPSSSNVAPLSGSNAAPKVGRQSAPSPRSSNAAPKAGKRVAPASAGSNAAISKTIAKVGPRAAPQPPSASSKSSSNKANPGSNVQGAVALATRTNAKGATVSPMAPRKLNIAPQKAGGGNSDMEAPDDVSFSQSSHATVYTLIMLRVPTFNRFAVRWNAIGSMTGKAIVTQYNPTTFVQDFIRDMTTTAEQMDRPTAVQVFGAVVHYLKSDSKLDVKLRSEWVRAYCNLVGDVMPATFNVASTVREASKKRSNIKRARDNSNSDSSSLRDGNFDDLSDQYSDLSLSDEQPVDPVAAVKSLQILNASTVWGDKAGFSIVPHERILEIHRRKAQEALAANVNAAKSATITWPKLTSWTKEAWQAFDKAWWNCIVEAVNSGAYSTMMSLIDLNLHEDIQLDLSIDADNWFDTPEIDFLRKAHGHWGPENKEEALTLLRQAHVHVRKGSCPPQVFLNLLSNFNTTFLRILDLQIAPSIRKWPDIGRPKYGLLEVKTIRKAFKDGFASCKDFSPACKHCYDVADQNPTMAHRTLYAELRAHFQDDVKSLSRATMHGGSVIQGSIGNQPYGGSGQAHGGRADNRFKSQDQPRGGLKRTDSKDGPRVKKARGPSREFNIVQGKDRGKACGDYTKHYGQDCSAATCLRWNTKYHKRNHVWKDSAQEPMEVIPDDEYKKLRESKPQVVARNAKDRAEYRAQRATSKQEQYLSSVDVAAAAVVGPTVSETASETKANFYGTVAHSLESIASPPAEQQAFIDVVQVSAFTPSVELEELGFSQRFFGVAKFLKCANPPSSTARADTSLLFAREVDLGKHKRPPRSMQVHIDDTSSVNLIPAKALSQLSTWGKLRIIERRNSSKLDNDPRSVVQLAFQVASKPNSRRSNASNVTMTGWFVVDGAIASNVVVLSKSFADANNITGQPVSSSLSDSTDATDALVGRVFFDTGAQMSCISQSLVVPGLCYNRVAVNVVIMQGSHEAGKATEAVELCFDLIGTSHEATRHREWFLVWENSYGIILGDGFCDQFTSWKQRLASWDSDSTKQIFNTSTSFTSWTKLPASAGPTSMPQVNEHVFIKRVKPNLAAMQSRHPVTDVVLKHRSVGSRPILQTNDHLNYIPFDGLRPAGILRETSRRLEARSVCAAKERRLKAVLNSLPKDDRVAFDMAEMQNHFARDQQSMCAQILKDIQGLPAGLMMGTGSGGIVRRASLFEPMTHIPQSKDELVTPEIAAQTSAERYLLHKARRKDWQWFDDDTATYEALLLEQHKPLGISIHSTPLTQSQRYFVNWLSSSATNSCRSTWTSEQNAVFNKLRATENADAAAKVNADVAAIAMAAAEQSMTGVFQEGSIVKFVDCVRLPEFNNKLGRLYTKCAGSANKWQVRVLGRDNGQFVTCSEVNLKLHNEQRSFVSSSDANYHNVGIDDSGMPIENAEEAPKPVHRQFGKEYSAALTARIKEVLDRYPQLFDGDISKACDFEEMDIKLKPNAILPTKARYYRNTPLMREEVRKQIQEQLDAGIISRMPTAVVSNVLMVKRPHMPGRYRFVIDYRTVNDATVPDVLLMPDVKTQHDRLANKRIFGAVDISSYYRLIKLKKECRYLTGFATDEGTFVYNRVPMGVRNACSHAQRVLQEALANDPILGINGANIRNYFDDIAWGSTTEDEFISVLTALMEFGVSHGLKYNIDKSCFGVDSITHVGFIADKDGIRIDPERTRDIVNLEAPKSTAKVQSILGVLNFVRNFIPNFSAKAKFLTDRLEKSAVARDAGKKFIWSQSDAASFDELKHLVASAPLLSVLDYSKPIYIRCDSSRYGAGAVLFQYTADGRELPVCYASRKYTPTETRYSTFQQEMGCVVWSLERFQEYTMGYKVIVETDHRNISFVKRSVMPQLARWRMRLESFEFDIHYRCGALQQVADGLSRSACDEAGQDAVAVHYRDVLPECSLANAAPSEALSMVHVDSIDVLYSEHNALSSMWGDSVDMAPHDVDAEQDDVDEDAVDGADSDEALPSDNDFPSLPWDDPAAVRSIIESVHNDIAGHGGVLVTLQRLLRKGSPTVSRKQMLRDIDAFLQGCVGCQKMRKRSTGSAVTRRVITGSPFSDLSIDILKLPFPDAYNNQYIVCIVDNFSHWVSTYACANKSAVCATRALIHHIGVFGVPLRLRSDGGGEFCNDIVKQLAHLIDFKQIVIQPYLHTANGVVERVNRSILERLRYILFDRRIKRQPKLQWTDLLPLAQRIVNSSTHSAIGTSPARLIFGDNLDIDRCILSRPAAPVVGKVVPDYVCQLSAMQAAMFEAANDHQVAMQQKIIAKATRANAGKPIKTLAVGDIVLVRPLSDFPVDKLQPNQLGPLYVIDLLEGGLVSVHHPHSNKISTVSDFQCELFDNSMSSSVEGLRQIAETDGFEFAVDAILSHGLLTGDDDIDPTPLMPSHVRKQPAKNYGFLIKWTGYETPTWIAYKAARRLPHFDNYVGQFPGLKMIQHS